MKGSRSDRKTNNMGGGRRERKRREGNGERGRERGRKGGREKDQGPHCHFGADGLAGRGEGGGGWGLSLVGHFYGKMD